jgi:hypothetical protein
MFDGSISAWNTSFVAVSREPEARGGDSPDVTANRSSSIATDVRRLGLNERSAAVATLARAFHDDPHFSFLIPSGCHRGRIRAAGDVSPSASPAISDQCIVSVAVSVRVSGSMRRSIALMQQFRNRTGISQCWAVTRGGNDEASGPRSSSQSCAALKATECVHILKRNAATTLLGTVDSGSK